jgi:hypothetical protein
MKGLLEDFWNEAPRRVAGLDNPFLTRSAAERLRELGQAAACQEILDQIGEDDMDTASDPLEILIAHEEYGANQGD